MVLILKLQKKTHKKASADKKVSTYKIRMPAATFCTSARATSNSTLHITDIADPNEVKILPPLSRKAKQIVIKSGLIYPEGHPDKSLPKPKTGKQRRAEKRDKN